MLNFLTKTHNTRFQPRPFDSADSSRREISGVILTRWRLNYSGFLNTFYFKTFSKSPVLLYRHGWESEK